MKDLSSHILDIAENSLSAGASAIRIRLEQKEGWLKIGIEDDGMGMTPEELERSSDPFYTSRTFRRRRIGLGIPLLRQHAELAGGRMVLSSGRGVGTQVEAKFRQDHPDRQPLGDLEACWILLATMNQGIEWSLELETEVGEFEISTREIREELEIDEIGGWELKESLKRLIRNNIDELGFEGDSGLKEN